MTSNDRDSSYNLPMYNKEYSINILFDKTWYKKVNRNVYLH